MAIKIFDRDHFERVSARAKDIKGISVDIPLDSGYEAQMFIDHTGGCVVLNGTTVHNLIQATIEQNPKFRKLVREYCDIRDDYDRDPTGFYFINTVRKASEAT
jgi:hypothetical protein